MTIRTRDKNHINNSVPQKRFIQSPLSSISELSTKAGHSAFKTWPHPMIESRGDYREDSVIEDIVGGPLYEAQKTLPKLPIPEIKDSIMNFLPTALPLADSEEEARKLIEACKEFPAQAENLHKRLIERRELEMKDSSWLQLWWNTAGYLQVRDPVTINVSYFFHFADDPSIADTVPVDKPLGIKRGASMLHAAAEFRKMICSGTFPHERVGRKEPKTPFCSVAFKYMFNSCRVPRREQDTYRMYDPSLHKHCIIARKGHFFAIDFVDENGDPLPVQVIEQRLEECIALADVEGEGPMLGWLTSSDRDSWADARDELLNTYGSDMKNALERLESGALLLCLDDETPVSKKECADLFLTGNLSSGNNRWFDKSIQLFVTENGKAGLQGEHSMMDGMPVIAFSNYITNQSYSDAEKKSSSKDFNLPDDKVESIFAKFHDDLSSTSAMVEKAKSDFTTLVTSHEQNFQSFQGYGSTLIKKMGYSPDAYAQMAIQLAVYRLHGKQVGTYEATQMRPFLHGRTETTRTVSKESADFVKSMGMMANINDNSSSLEAKRSLLQKAVKSHVNFISNAAKGKEFDRHLFGISMLANEEDPMPSLYSDPLFVRSKRWRVSTSHLTHPNIDNWGFGEVVPDGLGVGYAIKSDSCVFNICARKEQGWTDKFSHLLEEALLEMKTLHNPTLSKL